MPAPDHGLELPALGPGVPPLTRRACADPPVAPSPGLYSARLLERFAGDGHAAFVSSGGHVLRPRLARALELAELFPGLHVVDVGSGRGEAAARSAAAGCRVTAVDWSRDALALTGRSARAVRAEVVTAAADATALPLADGCADRVLLLDVIEHLSPEDVAATLAEARRILSPGGYVVIHTLPNRWSLAVGYRVLRLLARDVPRDPRSGYERLVHVNEQDPWRLKRSLTAAGLASRVWVEEWSTSHAAAAGGSRFADRARAEGYPVLRRRWVRTVAGLTMRGPARWLVANDIFAVAWPSGSRPSLTRVARMRYDMQSRSARSWRGGAMSRA